ncbi:MAG: CocE/NonD family hydrolase [Halobacteriales archaeon]
MAESVLVPGGRDVRGRLDAAGGEATSCVVACPPHPQQGGTRRDPRLRWVSLRLQERGIDCLRFDYGPWDEGRGERADARNAVDWAHDRYDRVALFGYSFGATIALLAAADLDGLAAVSALAPAASLGEDRDAVAAVDRTVAPLQVLVGEDDGTVDWKPVAERAREREASVKTLPGDHFFGGCRDRVGEAVGAFLAEHASG